MNSILIIFYGLTLLFILKWDSFEHFETTSIPNNLPNNLPINSNSFNHPNNRKVLISFKLVTKIENVLYYLSVATKSTCSFFSVDGTCSNRLIMTKNKEDAIKFDLEKNGINYLLKYQNDYVTECCEKQLCLNGIRDKATPINIEMSKEKEKTLSIKNLNNGKYITYCHDEFNTMIDCVPICFDNEIMSKFVMLEKTNNPDYKI